LHQLHLGKKVVVTQTIYKEELRVLGCRKLVSGVPAGYRELQATSEYPFFLLLIGQWYCEKNILSL